MPLLTSFEFPRPTIAQGEVYIVEVPWGPDTKVASITMGYNGMPVLWLLSESGRRQDVGPGWSVRQFGLAREGVEFVGEYIGTVADTRSIWHIAAQLEVRGRADGA